MLPLITGFLESIKIYFYFYKHYASLRNGRAFTEMWWCIWKSRTRLIPTFFFFKWLTSFCPNFIELRHKRNCIVVSCHNLQNNLVCLSLQHRKPCEAIWAESQWPWRVLKMFFGGSCSYGIDCKTSVNHLHATSWARWADIPTHDSKWSSSLWSTSAICWLDGHDDIMMAAC